MSLFKSGHDVAEVLAIIFIDKVKTTSHRRKNFCWNYSNLM